MINNTSEDKYLQDMRLVSRGVQEIISTKPAWIVRNGTTLFSIIILLLILSTFFIRYPDIVVSKIRISSINSPKAIKVIQEGKLVKLFVSEGMFVNKGQVLGFIESTADHQMLIDLSSTIDSFIVLLKKNEPNKAVKYFVDKNIENQNYSFYAGEVEFAVATFIQSFNSFRQYLESGYYLQKTNMFRDDLSYLEKLHDNLIKQKKMLEEDLSISKENFNANDLLRNEKVISPLDYRLEKSKFIGKSLTIPQITSVIISNESQQHDKKKEIAELENTIKQQKTIFTQALNLVKSQIDEWKKKYLLVAPISGKAHFVSYLQENQQLYAAQTFCFVNPGNSEYFAEATIPQYNFGKVQIGQQVLIKLSSYPYQEFGSISGKISHISSLPTDSGFTAIVKLPNILSTNSQKVLQFYEGLVGEGEIVTADQKIFDKLFKQLKQLAKRN